VNVLAAIKALGGQLRRCPFDPLAQRADDLAVLIYPAGARPGRPCADWQRRSRVGGVKALRTIGISTGVGAGVALLLTSYFNQSCDSFAEVVAGCTHYDPARGLLTGAYYGVIVGAIIVFARWVRQRRAARS
jgi:hypothetical protein